jgi:hypothetical protein
LIVELAKIKLAQMKEQTKQQKEDTKQLTLLGEIAKGSRATASEALELIKWGKSTTSVAMGKLEISDDEWSEARAELEAETKRIEEFKDNSKELEQIDEQTMNRLTSRIRPMIPEMTLPLRRSAKSMYLAPSNGSRPFVFINDEIARSLVQKTSEEEVSEIEGRVKSYDRDAGIGKFTSSELPRVLNFVVPLSERDQLRDQILEAMRRNKVVLACRKITDQSGLATSLILIDIRLE